MDSRRFDELVHSLADGITSRRTLAKTVAGGALAAVFARLGMGTEPVAAAGCRKVGAPCRRAGQCCSGRCRGPAGKKTCRAHDVGTCKPDQSVCKSLDNRCGDGCSCFRTTGGAGFCGTPAAREACERDADCEALGLTDSACVRGDGPNCDALGATFCAVPCRP